MLTRIFLVLIIPPCGVVSLIKVGVQFGSQDISKSITARSFKLGQQIEDDG